MTDPLAEAAEVRTHIKAGGLHKLELVEGITYAGDDPGDVIGLRIFTRTTPDQRWRKRLVFWGKGDDTIRSLRAKWDAWLAQDEARP